jgi:membrane-associated phospholipid phosphatase
MRPGGTKTDAVGQTGAGGILCDFDIENNDGCPTEYDRNGNLVVGKETNPGEFCEYSRKHLYANSYPSGHSAGIWNTALMLMEIMPDRADRIMRAANEYAMSRVIARYHWNSDTIVGRVLGSAINAVTHATNDYDSRLSNAKSEL